MNFFFKNKKKIKKDLNVFFDEIYTFNTQNWSSNGVALYKNKKSFFKVTDKKHFFKEINGYLNLSKGIPTANMLFIKQLNPKNYLIVFECDLNIKKDEGLLNDIFVKNDLLKCINIEDNKKIESVLRIYEEIYTNLPFKSKDSPNNFFFTERVDSRMLKWYKKLVKNNQQVEIGDKKYHIGEIISETINYFRENENTDYDCYMTQGDPNTLNISVTPMFFDLASAGYNSILGELSIVFISTLLYDPYFCPKYHAKSYNLHDQCVKNLEEFKPSLNYEKKIGALKLNCKIMTSLIRKNYVKSYINILKNYKVSISKNIIYFIVMRLLCVFDINKMSDEDYYYSLYLICYLYDALIDSRDVYLSLNNIIDEMGVINNEK